MIAAIGQARSLAAARSSPSCDPSLKVAAVRIVPKGKSGQYLRFFPLSRITGFPWKLKESLNSW